MDMTALRVSGGGGRRAELCLDPLLDERRAVGAETGWPREGEAVPEGLGGSGQSTAHGSARAMRAGGGCQVSGDLGADSGGSGRRGGALLGIPRARGGREAAQRT